ncbi:MAG: hypothetical protein JWR35_2924 [Marmoricola sp.]|nr:hypothetical protein [Marmoricola sp.]
MAKKNQKNNDRRAMVEEMRRQQQRKERQRSVLILGFCVILVLGLLSAALVPYIKNQRAEAALNKLDLENIGVSESAASCDPIKTTVTDHNQNHISAPTPIVYKDAPPSFGPHRPAPAAFARKFYTADDRPEVAELVHNLEHGYTILWYDDTAAKDKAEMKNIQAIATKYKDVRFIAAPWTATDGAAFPSGKHISLTRWSADASNTSDESKQRGNWEYCGTTSGAVVSSFVKKWPNSESPEVGLF